ncbi:MAG: hypothetical protein JNM56_36355 [Planctomycetia bacterium]|nr:hypothetical protein [Planctomycetia bacterium]
MLTRFPRYHRWLAGLAGLALWTAPSLAGDAQIVSWLPRKQCDPAPCVIPCPTPTPVQIAPPDVKPPEKEPEKKEPEKKDVPPIAQPPVVQPEAALPPLASAPEMGPALGGEGFSLASSNVGYIDSAIPQSQIRLRADAAYRNNRPDRAEFFYPKCGCFRGAPAPFTDLSADGPPLPESEVDYQEFSLYMEYAFSQRLSAFVETPFRLINPVVNNNSAGLSDIIFGGKYAFVAEQDRYLTAQVKTFAPSGDSDRGLGTKHWSVEPGLLWYRKPSENLTLEGEMRLWVPFPLTDFAGPVARYGIGAGYDIYKCNGVRITPVLELVGWTVLDGKTTVDDARVVADASGDTIINIKPGIRIGFGGTDRTNERGSFYFGYGRALTGEFWYKEVVRAEFRLTF